MTLLLVTILTAFSAAAQSPAADPPLTDVLHRVGAYVAAYQRDFSGVVAEEAYAQHATSGSRFDQYGRQRAVGAKFRDLKSDLLLVKPEGSDRWLQFRDVYEVDGHAVRDRSQRLAKLFLQPSSSSSRQVEKITEESSRYNIGNVVRNVNTPMLALWVLLPENQYRFAFSRVEHPDGDLPADLWDIAYREVAAGTMIRGAAHQDLPVEGHFWIEPSSGRVRLSSLVAKNWQVRAQIDVTYAPDDKLTRLVPREMTETYGGMTDGATVEGHATYSNFRQFQVKVDEKIAPIK